MARMEEPTSTSNNSFQSLIDSGLFRNEDLDGEPECTKFTRENHSLAAFPIFSDIRNSGKFCDVVLKVEGRCIQAHRVILAGTMPYFHAMFTNDMAESRQREITLHGLEFKSLERLIEYAYTGEVLITTDNVQSLLVGASYLHIDELQQACSHFIMNRLQASNALGIQQFADALSCTALRDAARNYTLRHFPDVARSHDFLQLDSAHVYDIISHDQIRVTSEEQVFESVMRWVQCDPSQRLTELPRLLSRVRLPLLTPQYLSDEVSRDELVRGSLQCRDLIDEAKDYHLMPERRQLLQSERTRPRQCLDTVGLIYAVGGLASSGDSLSTVEVYSPANNEWSASTPMSSLRSRVGVAVLDQKLYAIGGYNGAERLNTVELYDPVSDQWSVVAPMTTRRSALGAACIGERLYVCGGYDGITSLSSVECYSAARGGTADNCNSAGQWLARASMSRHRSAAGVGVFQGTLYALGGHDGMSIFDSVEMYCGERDLWLGTKEMCMKRCRLGVAALDGRLFAAGGYDGNVFLRAVEALDPRSAQHWRPVAPMNVKRSRVALVANCGRLFAVGGYDGVSNLNSVEVYEPRANAWLYAPPMIAHVGGVGVGVIPSYGTATAAT